MTDTTETTETKALESYSELQEQIRALQEKARKQEAEIVAEENEAAKVDMPLADIVLKLDKNGSDVRIKNVTPAEVLFLVAEHHANAGGNPITDIRPQNKTIRVDPRVLRSMLSRKYSARKIEKLFPGSEPKLPTSFVRALGLGVTLDLGSDRFMTFEVKPENESVEA